MLQPSAGIDFRRSNTIIGLKSLILIASICSIAASAQYDHELTFQNMDKLGLFPNDFVNDIEMDDRGVLWIATNNGLCRYDSPNSVKVFNKGDIGIESDLIRVLESGSDSTLWIGTLLGGVTHYNYVTHESKTYNELESSRLSNNEVLALAEISPEEIWIGNEGGLDVLFPAEDSIYNFMSKGDSVQRIEGAILSIFVDDKGWRWLTTWDHGLYLYLPDESGLHDRASFRQILLPEFEGSSNVWKILQHDSNHYWLATHSGGLGYMSIPSEASLSKNNQDWVPKFEFYTTDDTDISLNYLTDLEYDSKGNLWISTSNGLNILPKEQIDSMGLKKPDSQYKLDFHTSYHRPQITTSLNDNNITSLFLDKRDLLWIGTSSGLNQFNELNNRFTPTFLADITGQPTLSADRVNTMTMIDQRTLLLGTSVNGFIGYNVETGGAIDLPPYADSFKEARIASLHQHGEHDLYVGTATGVFKVSLIVPYSITKYDLISGLEPERKPSFYVSSVLKDSQGRLWAGSESGLFLIDESDHSWKRKTLEGSVNKLFEDSEGNIWFTSYRGIKRILPGNGIDNIIVYLKGDTEDVDAITSNHSINVAEYEKKLYFGTVNGMFIYDLTTEQFMDFNKNAIQSVVNNLTITPEGILWAGSANGILRYDLNTDNSKLYVERDGIQLSSIRSDACLSGPNGQVFVGCHGGFLRLNEADWDQKTVNPEVFINSIRTTDEQGNVKIHRGLQNDHIDIDPNNISLEFRFVSNNYSQPRYNTFGYRLDGFEMDEWNYTTDEKVSYTNLDPGEYVFHIKTAATDETWPEEYKSLKIVVQPKFVETNLFKLLVLLATVGLMYLIVTYYNRATRDRNEILQKFNESLRKRDVKMRELVDQLDKSNKDLTRSNKELAQYAYITSHDLQEPLRTVGAFAGLLDSKTKALGDPEIREISGFIQNGVSRMSSLIKSLLSYSLLDKDTDLYENVDLTELVEGKTLGLAEYIRQHNAKVLIGSLPTIMCLKEQIGTVFYNLILNGIKFNKSENPTISIEAQEHDDHWQCNVSDNGIGIPEEHQKKIFEIFTRLHLKEEYEGTGIGLAVCNKIINNHQGTLSLQSKKGEGSTFSFTISKHLNSPEA